MYSKKVVEHFMNPRNMGEMENPDAVAQEGNPVCGDMMRVYLKMDRDKIEDIKFMTFGCAAAIACASIVSEMAKGKTIQEFRGITRKQIVEALGGLPAHKYHCSKLALDTVNKAIEKWEDKKGKSGGGSSARGGSSASG